MNAHRPHPAAAPSRDDARRTTAPALALAGLGAQAPVRLGAAPAPLVELPWTLGLVLLGLVPGLLLYRRLRRPQVLDHDHREAILDHLADEAPATVGALARALDLDYKTVQHHVRVLEDFGLVEARDRGRHRAIFPADEAPPELPDPLAGEHATALALLRVVAEEPGLTQTEAAARLDLARSTVHWHAQRLAEKDLLRAPDGAPGLEAGPALEDVRDVLDRDVDGRQAS